MKKERREAGVKFGNLFFMDGWCIDNANMGPEQEIRECFKQVADYLKKEGVGLENVLKVTVYLKDISDRERYMNKVWQEYFPKDAPVRCTVEVGLGTCRIELDVITAWPEK